MGHPSKFQRVSHLAFFTAATLLTGGQPNFARCLAVSWLVHYIYTGTLYIHFRRGSGSLTEFCPVRNSLYVQVLPSLILAALLYCTVLEQRASAKLCGVVQGMELRNIRRGRHLYSAGRLPRWASAHILVFNYNEADAQRDGRPDEYRWRPLRKFRNSIPCIGLPRHKV